jgi:hypothetical protein
MLINNAVLTGSFTVNGVNYITNTPSTGSNTFVGTQIISGSTLMTGSLGVTGSVSVSGSITATGTLTAQTLVVQTITSSIVYSSGSNIFGNQLTDVQQMTGSLRVTGSGNHYIQGGKVAISSSVAADVLLNVVNPSSTGFGMNISAASGSGTYALRVENYNGASSLLYVRGDGNVGIGTTSPSYKLFVAGEMYSTGYNVANSGGSFQTIDAGGYISLKGATGSPVNAILFGTNGTEKMRLTNSGSVLIGTETEFSTGYKLQVSNGNIRHYQNNENCEFAHNGDMTIANGGTKTLSCANGGLVFVSENNTGDGALFFCGYKSATIILIADPNNRYAATDTAGKACLYKSANTGVVTFKNNLGSSLSFTMYQIKNSD